MLSNQVLNLITYDVRHRMAVTDPAGLAGLVERAQAADVREQSELRALGLGLMLLGSYEAAAGRFRSALEQAGTPADVVAARIGLADVYRHRGDLPAAELMCRMTLPLARAEAPELTGRLLLLLGATLAEQGRTEEAGDVLADVVASEAGDPRPDVLTPGTGFPAPGTPGSEALAPGAAGLGSAGLGAAARAMLDSLDDLVLPLPPAVVAVLGEKPEWSLDHDGASGSLARSGPYFVRRGPEAVAEHDRLTWLRAWHPVPEVAAFAGDVLVTADTGVETWAGHEESGDPVRVGTAMGDALRKLHAVPVAECPFDGRLDVLLDLAARNVLEGRVDPEDFDDDNLGRTPAQVLARLHAERPASEDLVVAHGDFTPSNLMTNGVLIDLARLGVADRHRDLAIALRDLEGDFGDEAVAAFLAAYGPAAPDPAKLAYYRLIDELF
ncbi:aminoglycoside 3'-phosphotransferase [Nonomuraea typhae]|uniref:Aminoglycoside 3'-phosphotransferase n=1 Tax=Nonomuraea typhae TaxID=2603600 RepID=A0ABW7YNF9_9ACTN